MKPFIGTLRVANPVRQSRASSRKRVLRGERRLSLRSVVSEIKRCAIEPRNLLVVSPRPCQSRGPRQATNSWSTQPAWSRRGRRTGRMIIRFPGNLGDLAVSTIKHRMGAPDDQLQDDPRPRVQGRWGRTGGARVVSPSEGNEARRDGRQGVAAPHSSGEAGERPIRTPWSEGGAALWTGSWNHAEDIAPHQRVTAKLPSRVRDSDSPA